MLLGYKERQPQTPDQETRRQIAPPPACYAASSFDTNSSDYGYWARELGIIEAQLPLHFARSVLAMTLSCPTRTEQLRSPAVRLLSSRDCVR